MSEQVNVSPESNADNMFDPTQSINLVQETLGKIIDVANVDAVYGEPIANGDMLVVPSAEIVGLVGFGVGTGRGRAVGFGKVGGAVGWSRVFSRPVAAIVITPDSVRIEPIVDVTKVALAAFTTAGFMLAMIARMSRRRAPRMHD
jgi:uncharacterized spore protein YtfJ